MAKSNWRSRKGIRDDNVNIRHREGKLEHDPHTHIAPRPLRLHEVHSVYTCHRSMDEHACHKSGEKSVNTEVFKPLTRGQENKG